MHIDPVKALFWAAILNGVVAAPLMAVIMVMASSKKVMGQFVISPTQSDGVDRYFGHVVRLYRRISDMEIRPGLLTGERRAEPAWQHRANSVGASAEL